MIMFVPWANVSPGLSQGERCRYPLAFFHFFFYVSLKSPQPLPVMLLRGHSQKKTLLLMSRNSVRCSVKLRLVAAGVWKRSRPLFLSKCSRVQQRCLCTCSENLFDTNYVGIKAVLGPVMVTPLRAGSGPNRGICRSVGEKQNKTKKSWDLARFHHVHHNWEHIHGPWPTLLLVPAFMELQSQMRMIRNGENGVSSQKSVQVLLLFFLRKINLLNNPKMFCLCTSN